MWVICNGAPKSGSTWIFQLLKRSGAFADLPVEFQAANWRSSSVDLKRVDDALIALGEAGEAYVTKQHWSETFDYALQSEAVMMANIIRDIRDVIVSRYHHEARVNDYSRPISRFLRDEGAKFVRSYSRYHEYWAAAGAAAGRRYYITSYEYLRDQEEKAASEFFDVMPVDIPASRREKAIASCNFENRSGTGPGKHFRRAKVFGFRDEISAADDADILAHARKYGLLEVKRKIAAINPALKPYLAETDLGL